MTTEELKQEAEEWLNKWELCNKCDHKVQCIEDNAMCPQVVERAYIASAEPREKCIAELETQVKTAYRKGMRHMAKALKDYDRTDGAWTDYFEHTVDKVLQREQVDFEEYGTLADQLTKAKELLKKVQGYTENLDDEADELYDEIEQFLNSEVEK